MGATMTKRQQSKQQKQRNSDLKRMHAVMAFIEEIGIIPEYQTLRREYRWLMTRPMPGIKFALEGDGKDKGEKIIAKIREGWNKYSGVDGSPSTMIDYWRHGPAIPGIFSLVLEGRLPSTQAEKDAAARAMPKIEIWKNKMSEALSRLQSFILYTVGDQSDLTDTTFYCKTFDEGLAKTVTITGHANVAKYININGLNRRCFPLIIKGKQQKDCRKKPVYIQVHAIERYKERMDDYGSSALPNIIKTSFKKGKINRELPGTTLLECIIDRRVFATGECVSDKVGYFIINELKDCTVISTYLLMTMKGTPEYRQLKERLRLSEIDIDYLKLDHYNTFLRTDLFRDQRIAEIFRSCGCGALVDAHEIIVSEKMLTDDDLELGWANDFAKYFRINK